MKLLFTGASGFLGRNIKSAISRLYEVTTIGLVSDDSYQVDISKNIPVFNDLYDIVLHAAGKAHCVPGNSKERREFYDINYQGTINLCKALEISGLPKSFIFISSVAVYGLDSGSDITENCPLNGSTPYALSKIYAERFLQNWCAKNNVHLSIIRPSLLAGPDPPGNLGDMIRSIAHNQYLSIAGGKARKSMLMVQDIANLLPLLIEKDGIYNVCDNHHPSFRELEKTITMQLGKKLPVSIPFFIALLAAFLGNFFKDKLPINTLRLKKMTQDLTFSNEKAKSQLGWEPLDVLDNFRI